MKHMEKPASPAHYKERPHGIDRYTPPPEKINLDALKRVADALERFVDAEKLYDENERYRQSGAIHATVERFLDVFLDEFGLSKTRMKPALLVGDEAFWMRRYDEPTVSPRYALDNMRRMIALEEHVPGSVRYLYTRRGIRNFARYSIDFWKRQYAEREVTLPYMLAITASGIEKGTAAGTIVYKQLQMKLERLRRPHLMRMIEIFDLPDLVRLLSHLDHAHNKDSANPISLVLFDGHGNADRVIFGAFKSGGRLHRAHILSSQFKTIFTKYFSRAFAPKAQFIFGSCDAAGNMFMPGVATTLKETLRDIFSERVSVFGSEDELTPFVSLDPRLKKDGSLTLDCTTQTYEDYDILGRPRAKRPRLKRV